jgi:selenide,water dikinase
MVASGVRAATDVTGFGLLGHLRAMLRASGVGARLRAEDVPIMTGARVLAQAGHVPGGTHRNLVDIDLDVSFSDAIDETARILLADAQTSGGLLMCVAPERVDDLLAGLAGRSPVATVVGRVEEGPPGKIVVV